MAIYSYTKGIIISNIIVDFKIQIFASVNFFNSIHFNKPYYDHYSDLKRKPSGGLWTSTYLPKYGSNWIKWCITNDIDFLSNARFFKLELKQNLNVLHIQSLTDIDKIPLIQINNCYYFDLIKINEQNIDGIHVSEEMILEFYHRDRSTLNFFDKIILIYGWDTESTLWFNLDFFERNNEIKFYLSLISALIKRDKSYLSI